MSNPRAFPPTRRWKFTSELWWAWWEKRQEKPSKRLVKGIAEMRRAFAEYDR